MSTPEELDPRELEALKMEADKILGEEADIFASNLLIHDMASTQDFNKVRDYLTDINQEILEKMLDERYGNSIADLTDDTMVLVPINFQPETTEDVEEYNHFTQATDVTQINSIVGYRKFFPLGEAPFVRETIMEIRKDLLAARKYGLREPEEYITECVAHAIVNYAHTYDLPVPQGVTEALSEEAVKALLEQHKIDDLNDVEDMAAASKDFQIAELQRMATGNEEYNTQEAADKEAMKNFLQDFKLKDIIGSLIVPRGGIKV
jgi:hypothetical protein